ncbi:hypothetical protein [Chryseobacterium pennipullorum]|uniref:Uncharacterized protein n=1 Tax=Chryseobacterium pennipullorum TaxID=2258963 RepID=A0A3D9ASY1_9FLAO|nr:hypothetical protein [Chryseobacterium pennipullorum]REC44202.1 hypothetical protein DRF67_17895 [Chryseobacterium pennipullorum]
MDNTYFFSAFGTFGNPNGFRQSFFLGGNHHIAKEIRTFDLKTDAIKLFTQSTIYSIRKDYAGGCNLISYSVYTFAKEQNSDRGGTFIGSSLLFVHKIASEGLIISALNDFQRSLEKNNLSEGVITVNHSEQFSIQKPRDFDKIGFNVREIDELDFTRSNHNYLVVYCKTSAEELQNFYSKAIDLLNVYDTIYFTQSHEIAEFVKQKGIFKIVNDEGFDMELHNLEEERRRILQSAITELKREKEGLKDEKTKLLEDLNRQISHNEKRHQDNESKIKESKNRIEIISKEYDQYSEKIEELIRNLTADGKIEAAKKLHQEHKRLLTNTIHQNKGIESLSSLSSSSNARVQPARDDQPYSHGLSGFHSSGRNREKEFRVDGFKVATLILSLLLIGALVLCCLWIPKEYTTSFHTL